MCFQQVSSGPAPQLQGPKGFGVEDFFPFQGAQWLEEGGPLATLQHRWAPLLKALRQPRGPTACLRLGLVGPTALGATARLRFRDGGIGPKVNLLEK